MPNIVEYNAPGEITPSDRGIQAAEMAGRRIGGFYHQVAGEIQGTADKVQQHMAVMEISELYKTGPELKINLQQKFDTASALPENRNDPHFGDRFMAEVGPLIDQWGSGAGTDRGKLLVAEMKAGIRTEVFHHVSAGQAEMDTAHVMDNGQQVGNTLGSGLITDPSEANLNRSIGTMKDAIQGMTMSIQDVGARERVATELTQQYLPNLVIARYRGVAESIKQQVSQTGGDTSPAADQMAKDVANQVGFEHLKPEQQTAISTLRDEAVKQGQELFRTRDAAARKADSDAFDAALLPIETGMFTSNGAGGVTMAVTPDSLAAVQRAAQMPGAKQHPEKIEALLNAMHTATQDALAGKETTTDHGVYTSLSARIGSTTNPLTKTEVDDMRAQHRLSDSDYSFLRGAAADSKLSTPKMNHAIEDLHRFFERIKPMIDKSDPLAGNIDQAGTEKFSYFTWDAENTFRKMTAAGIDPDKAVQALTDPHRGDSLYHYIPQYQTTNKQGLANVLAMTKPGGVQPQAPVPGGVRGAVPKPNPGESPAAYLKRTNQ